MRVFIDSNLPMYVAGTEHPHRAPARRFMEWVQPGEIEGCASTEVLQEILYRYAALRRLDLARDVYDSFVQICPVVFAVTLADTDRARDLLLAAVMINQQVEWIASFDHGFDRVRGVRRFDLSRTPRQALAAPGGGPSKDRAAEGLPLTIETREVDVEVEVPA